MTNVIIALAVATTPHTARIVRASVLVVREQEFVEAARALGATELRVLFRHVLPNALGPLIVRLTYVFATAILAEAALSFIGVGPPPPAPSFGSIIAQGRDFIAEAPWITIFPGPRHHRVGPGTQPSRRWPARRPRPADEDLMPQRAPILEIEGLTTALAGGATRSWRTCPSIFEPGEVLGVVGESGSGKSMLALSVMGLLPKAVRRTAGRIMLDGEDLAACRPSAGAESAGATLP